MNFIKGKRLTKKEVNQILKNFYLTTHSVKQLSNRRWEVIVWDSKGRIDLDLTKENVIEDIRKNLYIAYFDTDKSVNVAIDDFNYYVFAPSLIGNKVKYWTLVTFKEPSVNGVNVFEKQKYAEINHVRKGE